MTTSITKYPSVDIRVAQTGGGHFNTHIVVDGKFLSLNDGAAKQLYLALRELFEAEQLLKIDELYGLAYQYIDDLNHPPEEDSKKRRLERIKEVIG